MGLLKAAGTLSRRRGRAAGSVKPSYLPATESELAVPEKFEIENVKQDAPLPETPLAGIARCEVQCTFVGDFGTGKSSLLQMMGKKEKTQSTNSQQPSEEIFERYCARVTSRSGEKVNVKYCKSSADEKHSRMRALCFQVTDVFFLVFSTIDRSSFESAQLVWFPEIDQLSPDAPVYLIGTKCDQRDEAMKRREASHTCVTTQEGHLLADKLNAIMYIETEISEHKETLLPVIKEVAEAVLRQVEHRKNLAQLNLEYNENEENEPTSTRVSVNKHASIRRKTRQSHKRNPVSPKEDHKRSVKLDARKRKESFAVLSSTRRDSIAPREEEVEIERQVSGKRVRDLIDEPEAASAPAKKKTRVSIMDNDLFEAPSLDFCAIPEGDSLADSAAVAKDVAEPSVEPSAADAINEPVERVSLRNLRRTLSKVARRTSARFQPILTRSTSSKKILTRVSTAPFPEVPLYTESKVNIAVLEQSVTTENSIVGDASPEQIVDEDSSMGQDTMEDTKGETVEQDVAKPAEGKEEEKPDIMDDDDDDDQCDDDDDDDDDDYDESDEEAVFCNW